MPAIFIYFLISSIRSICNHSSAFPIFHSSLFFATLLLSLFLDFACNPEQDSGHLASTLQEKTRQEISCGLVMIYSATHARGSSTIRLGGGADDASTGANTTSTSGGDAGQFLYFSYFTSLSFIGIMTWTVIQAVRLTKMVWLGGDISDEGRVDQRADEEKTRSEKEVDEEKRRVSVEEIGGTRDSNPTEGSGGERRGWKVLNLAYEVLYSTISTFREYSSILFLLGNVELCWSLSYFTASLDHACAHICFGVHPAILVTIIYWALLSSPSTFATSYSAYSSTSQHILNAVVSLAETFILTSSPSTTNAAGDKQRKTNLPYIYLPITVVLLGLYLCVAYITNASQGVYGTSTFTTLSPHSPRRNLSSIRSPNVYTICIRQHLNLPRIISLPILRPVEGSNFGGVYSRDWARAMRRVCTRSMGSYVEGLVDTYVRGMAVGRRAVGRGAVESGSAWGSFIGLKEKGGDVRLLGCATIVVGIL
ncbi:hypothetical protein AB1N83_012204 [Pleurotus pulmonarius]